MKRIMVMGLVLFWVFILASGCGSAQKAEVSPAGQPPAEKGVGRSQGAANAVSSQSDITLTSQDGKAFDSDIKRKVTKDVSLVIAVTSVKDADSRIQEMLKDTGGYIQSSGIWTENGRMQGKMTLRVPEGKLEGFLGGVEALGKVERKNVGGKDVTEEYYDTAARKTTLEKQEKRLLELLGKAGNVKEMLEIENELARVRGQIESLQARLKVLDNLTDFATVNIEIREPKTISTGEALKEPLGERVKAAWLRGVNGVVDFVELLVVLMVMILPYSPLLAVGGYAAHRVWKKRRAEKRQ